MLDETKRRELKATANEIRKWTLEMLQELSEGQFGTHIGGSLSIVDILTVLYFDQMNVKVEDPKWADRDRLILSKGHAGPGLYATLARKGFFPKEMLFTLNRPKTNLPSHCDRIRTPGIDMTCGSLGQGISAAAGQAMAAKIQGRDLTVYAIVGDGEIEEGQVWEAFMAAAKYKLDNFCAIVDVNGLQIDGRTCDVMPTEPMDEKFAAFGAHVIKIDGHNYDEIKAALAEAKTVKGKPTVILAKTVKGKGVSFMEDNAGWHGKAPNDEQFATAKAELEAVIKELEG